jgi:hypothetical protein
MKIASYTSIIIVVSWTVLTLLQLWGFGIEWGLYLKITITMALLGGGIVIAALIFREYGSEKKMKKEKFLD